MDFMAGLTSANQAFLCFYHVTVASICEFYFGAIHKNFPLYGMYVLWLQNRRMLDFSCVLHFVCMLTYSMCMCMFPIWCLYECMKVVVL